MTDNHFDIGGFQEVKSPDYLVFQTR